MTAASRIEPIRVVLADPHPSARMSVAHLLDWEEGIEVVSEAACAADLLASVRQFEPDVAVIDIGLWREHPGRLLQELRGISSRIGIIVLTMYEEESRSGTFATSAITHVLKDSSPAEMIAAVRSSAAAPGTATASTPLDARPSPA
jgi:DNA-binding NarL/FixJ family response regulator